MEFGFKLMPLDQYNGLLHRFLLLFCQSLSDSVNQQYLNGLSIYTSTIIMNNNRKD